MFVLKHCFNVSAVPGFTVSYFRSEFHRTLSFNCFPLLVDWTVLEMTALSYCTCGIPQGNTFVTISPRLLTDRKQIFTIDSMSGRDRKSINHLWKLSRFSILASEYNEKWKSTTDFSTCWILNFKKIKNEKVLS